MGASLPFLDSAWREALARAGLNRFEDFWSLGQGQVEAGNRARGGWSEVRRAEILGRDGAPTTLFIKRQENFRTRDWLGRHIPVAQREFAMMQRLRTVGIPTTQPVYFATKAEDGDLRAVLVTIGLRDHIEWKQLEDMWRDGAGRGRARWNAIRAVGELVGHLHRDGLRHGSLYPKHIFVRDFGAKPVACLIDLEKMKSNFFGLNGVKRDLRTLITRCDWTATDRLRFALGYCASSRVTPVVRKVFLRMRHLGRDAQKARPE
jgi:hypothetical protein